jgi:hypothetical protein
MMHGAQVTDLDSTRIEPVSESWRVEPLHGKNICPLYYFALELPTGFIDSPVVPTELIQHVAEYLQNVMVPSLRLLKTQYESIGTECEVSISMDSLQNRMTTRPN